MRILDNELEDEFEINILPMIDVIFAILAFFIVSTLFLTRTEGLPVNLPETDTSEPQEPADFTVTIEPDGSLFLGELSVTEETLRTRIVQQLEPDQEALITIKADEQTYHGKVITVMDELRAIEGASLGIATIPETVSSEANADGTL
ncbi:biopolymer transporter ExbD [Leptolyngbya cf. ectocarpi LEGE 11479]|uniref:Biopolymer transporter ExbD n=1 Tax=Leptolyngbya cf. ectocarpi LEGE 11479 TaxID=1828722 RepID=A0A928ZZL6_LEPEC|nr:biopolymer transporter ExbD [Leptolyngbya ectocarpi]MBE9070362.1 biopolymer transporter ExbD [Leptolyngbya cf. ectocarpi LEGE 11479]